MHKLVFFVPESHKEKVKCALFQAGAGKLGCYDQCSWEMLGQGQFQPLAGAQPHLGGVGELEIVAEYRVEMVVDDALITTVIDVLREAHPYEEPAFDLWPLIS